MFRRFYISLIALIALSSITLPVQAQSFIRRRPVRTTVSFPEPFIQQTRTDFGSSFAQFNRDLSEMGDRMRDGYGNVSAQAAQTRFTDASVSAVNNNPSQQAFENGEAHSLNSGGNYNTPGRTMLWGNSNWIYH
jgi:hypothetical protein